MIDRIIELVQIIEFDFCEFGSFFDDSKKINEKETKAHKLAAETKINLSLPLKQNAKVPIKKFAATPVIVMTMPKLAASFSDKFGKISLIKADQIEKTPPVKVKARSKVQKDFEEFVKRISNSWKVAWRLSFWSTFETFSCCLAAYKFQLETDGKYFGRSGK